VSFTYDREVVLRGVSLLVEPGTRVGIVGPTGAGKTTLVSLLFRFYDPTAGCVLLDGVDVRQYRLVDLRNQFGVVLQEPVLFSTTIRENIAYGRPEAGFSDIMAAARAARVRVAAWTVNEEADIQRMIGLGVDMIMSDRPDLAKRLAGR